MIRRRQLPRLTIAALMLAIAAAGIGLGLYETGRRSAVPPPVPTVWITPRGSRYHAAGCRYAARGTPVRLDQVGPRYRPCAYCGAAGMAVPSPSP